MMAKQLASLLLLSTFLFPVFGQQNFSIENEIFYENSRTKRLLLPFYSSNQNGENSGFYNNPNLPEEGNFDFIVIGSGPSGAVIANRLSEIPTWNVLLLEAGSEPSPVTDLPFLAGSLQFTDYNWGYRAEKQDGYCLGCPDGRMWYPHGKALGGTTVINYMIHIRGNSRDYDRWAALGNPGWSYEEVLPYFIKSEDANIERQDAGYHQSGGYLSVSDVPYRTESAHAFVKAAQEAGHPYVDYNGKDQIGVSYVQTTTKRGKRCSAEKAFLRPVRNRKNLKILPNSRVVKILIDPETKQAYGVQYVRNRKYKTATATKEVILCAGGLNSPQLLMLSGVGPKDHLQELGIPVVQDLPVGQKLYDHITFIGLTFVLNDSITFQQEKITTDPYEYIRLITLGEGPLTTIGGIEALAYLRTNVSDDPDTSYPDMELIFIGGGIHSDRGLIYKNAYSINDETYNAIWKPLENKSAYQVVPMLVHPKSFGYIRLKSKNPFHWPQFYPNYFSDPENHDIRTFIASVREVQKIANSPSLQKYGATLVRTPVPGCESHVFDSDEYWECALRHITPTLHHQVATCKMGPTNDPEAVVDSKLKVYGIKNLRVADTSVIPMPVTAHTAEPAYMIGEKAGDLIKEDWRDGNSVLRPEDIRRSIKFKNNN